MNSGPSFNPANGDAPRIVWDGLGLFNEYSGVGQYGECLYRQLRELGVFPIVTALPERHPKFVTSESVLNIREGSLEALKTRLLSLKPVFPNESYKRACLDHKRVIYHGLSNINLPCFGQKRSQDRFVITIHDIIPLLTNKMSPLALQMRWLLPKVLERADQVITGSRWAMETVVTIFGPHLQDKITPLGYGIRGAHSHQTSPKKIDGLAIARGETYKRLQIVERIARDYPTKSFAVVTDSVGRRLLSGAPENMRVLVGIASAELDGLMNSSKILIHPSLYEGWCLPAADALARGLRVIYCGGSGIDEVCAYAPGRAVAVERNAEESRWSEAFGAALDAGNDKIVKIELPTWTEVAKKTLRIYESLI